MPSTLPPPLPPAAQVHKLLQGLIDQHSLAGQEAALGMAEGMASYFCGRCACRHVHVRLMVRAVSGAEAVMPALSGCGCERVEATHGSCSNAQSSPPLLPAARRVARVLEVNGTDHWQKILETEFGGMSEPCLLLRLFPEQRGLHCELRHECAPLVAPGLSRA